MENEKHALEALNTIVKARLAKYSTSYEVQAHCSLAQADVGRLQSATGVSVNEKNILTIKVIERRV